MEKKIVMLAGNGRSSNILFHALNEKYGINKIIIEERIPKKTLIKKRIRKLGLWKVAGQLLFQILIIPFLKKETQKRYVEILHAYGLKISALPADQQVKVLSVNHPETISILKEINPDLVIVNGTRIISQKVLEAIDCDFINIHTGVTPKYRGVHGGYWALVNRDKNNCGVTVHLVDKGIDTGSILQQGIIAPVSEDNFITYPLLQLVKGIELLGIVLDGYLHDKNIEIQKRKDLISKLWSHPTFLEYLKYRVVKKVK